jgi:hypothetical protein
MQGPPAAVQTLSPPEVDTTPGALSGKAPSAPDSKAPGESHAARAAAMPLLLPPPANGTSRAPAQAKSPLRLPTLVAVSISLGSSTRNSRAETTLLGRRVILSRLGTDGDRARARALFCELDGKVDAFGFGGGDLGVTVNGHAYPFTTLAGLVEGLSTPVVDGAGLRSVVERRLAQQLPPPLDGLSPRRVLITTAVDRYDLMRSFVDAGYEVICGDLGFVFGVPLALRSVGALNLVARVLMPAVRRLPFDMLYPTGKKQETIQTRFPRWFAWATVIGGDFLFLRTHLPTRLDGKVIVTNTTTSDDVALLRSRGARALVTSTPRIDGRSFGTNAVEAALTAISGKRRPLSHDELAKLVGDSMPPSALFFDGPESTAQHGKSA